MIELPPPVPLRIMVMVHPRAVVDDERVRAHLTIEVSPGDISPEVVLDVLTTAARSLTEALAQRN
jgi:hypothetical protein